MGKTSLTYGFMVSLAKGLNTEVRELVDFPIAKESPKPKATNK